MNWFIKLIKDIQFGKETQLSDEDFLAFYRGNPSVEVLSNVQKAQALTQAEKTFKRLEKLRKELNQSVFSSLKEVALAGEKSFILYQREVEAIYDRDDVRKVFNITTFQPIADKGIFVTSNSSSINFGIVFRLP